VILDKLSQIILNNSHIAGIPCVFTVVTLVS